MLEALGVIFLVLIALVVVLAIVAAITSASDIQRYLHIKRM